MIINITDPRLIVSQIGAYADSLQPHLLLQSKFNSIGDDGQMIKRVVVVHITTQINPEAEDQYRARNHYD